MLLRKTMLQAPTIVFACLLCVIAVGGLTFTSESGPPQAFGVAIVCGAPLILGFTKFNGRFHNGVQSLTTEQFICCVQFAFQLVQCFLAQQAKACCLICFRNARNMEGCLRRPRAYR